MPDQSHRHRRNISFIRRLRLAASEVDDPTMQWAGDGAALYYAFGERSRAMRAAIDQRKDRVVGSTKYRDGHRCSRSIDASGAATRDVVNASNLDPSLVQHLSAQFGKGAVFVSFGAGGALRPWIDLNDPLRAQKTVVQCAAALTIGDDPLAQTGNAHPATHGAVRSR